MLIKIIFLLVCTFGLVLGLTVVTGAPVTDRRLTNCFS